MIDSKNPKITVLMPVYNCELYIRESIDSILNQTYTNFEFLIIDDASIDKTVSIIKTYTDSRVLLIEKSQNTGYTNSLNYGLKVAKGEYIARMDGDDISLPERFAKQVAFLELNPDVVVCGSNFAVIGSEKVVNLPKQNEDIILAFLKGNCIAHPSVMIRNYILQQFDILYNPNKEPAEDYDLWVRLIKKGNFFNLQEELLNYRVHITQVSQKRKIQQIQSALESRLELLKYLKCTFNNSEYNLLKKMMQKNTILTFNEIKVFLILKDKMIKANSNDFFEPNGFQKYLDELQNLNFYFFFIHRNNFHPLIFFQYLKIKNKQGFRLKFNDEFKIFIKALIFFKRK